MTDPFDGTWTIDLNESVVWDDSRKMHVPDEVGEEGLILSMRESVQDYRVLYGDSPPKIRIGYKAAYDADEVHKMVLNNHHLEAEGNDFWRWNVAG